ncbi:MAG: hypothetical protein R8K46_08845, partial [Mariprofundaceae bacterium]
LLKTTLLFIALISLLIAAPVAAEENKELLQLPSPDSAWQNPMENTAPVFDSLDVELEQVTLAKFEACRRAFGDEIFCQCLSSKLPIGLVFDGYIQAVTKSRQELGYEHFFEHEKKMIDRAKAVRDECVADSDGH